MKDTQDMNGKRVKAIFTYLGTYRPDPDGYYEVRTEYHRGDMALVDDVYIVGVDKDGKETHRWNFRNVEGVQWK